MSNTLIDVDEAMLASAARLLGTTTKKATVNGALAEIVAADRRRQLVEALANDMFPDYGNEDVREQAWR